MKGESHWFTEARDRRASRLAEAVLAWIELSKQQKYPRSLHDILRAALRREYELGRRRGA